MGLEQDSLGETDFATLLETDVVGMFEVDCIAEGLVMVEEGAALLGASRQVPWRLLFSCP